MIYLNEMVSIAGVIQTINDELWAQDKSLMDSGIQYLEQSYNGYDAVITFMGFQLWNSVDECRPYREETDDYEPMELYLRARIGTLLIQLGRLKL